VATNQRSTSGSSAVRDLREPWCFAPSALWLPAAFADETRLRSFFIESPLVAVLPPKSADAACFQRWYLIQSPRTGLSGERRANCVNEHSLLRRAILGGGRNVAPQAEETREAACNVVEIGIRQIDTRQQPAGLSDPMLGARGRSEHRSEYVRGEDRGSVPCVRRPPRRVGT
jgi:hypothetical protein